MDDESDILQKADALLSKRRPAADKDFPILTEIVDPFTAATHILPSSTVVATGEQVQSATPQIDVNALKSRILERAMGNIDAASTWTGPSLRDELRNLVEASIENISHELVVMLNDKVRALVRRSIQDALESELVETSEINRLDKHP